MHLLAPKLTLDCTWTASIVFKGKSGRQRVHQKRCAVLFLGDDCCALCAPQCKGLVCLTEQLFKIWVEKNHTHKTGQQQAALEHLPAERPSNMLQFNSSLFERNSCNQQYGMVLLLYPGQHPQKVRPPIRPYWNYRNCPVGKTDQQSAIIAAANLTEANSMVKKQRVSQTKIRKLESGQGLLKPA